MPWRKWDTMSERLKFVGRLLDGEKMTDLCREFEISRKTGYKIFSRYKSEGVVGLQDKSRSAINRPNQTTRKIEKLIIEQRLTHPTWGAPKIKAILERRHSNCNIPACSTIHAILHRHNLISKKRRQSVHKPTGTDLTNAKKPNDLWCTDYKGQFVMKNGMYCYPLTISDQYSRYLLSCEALESTNQEYCIDVFERVFEEYGIPETIRSDNGPPFGVRSYFGISRLNIFWLRLGIRIERIQPGHPEENGRHERMHRTLKQETTKPPGTNLLSQQERFDAFKAVYNNERPHQALDMRTPSELYSPSKKNYSPFLDQLEYPEHDQTFLVTSCGSIYLTSTKRLYIGEPFGGQNVGVKKVEEDVWKVTFMNYDLGFFSFDNPKLQLSVNPFLIRS